MASSTKNGRSKKSKSNKSKPNKSQSNNKSNNKNTSNNNFNSSNSFVYGFKVHSLSQVNANANKQSPKKNKKNSPNKNRNKQNQSQQSSPFSTISNNTIELYTSSVSRLLDAQHLDAAKATSLHDLQCGTGTVALQAFLSYTNLRRVFGIEQNKNLFHWATKNLMALIKNGYQGNKYLLVEQIPSNKMTIAQKSSDEESQKKAFRVGEVVYAFIPLKQNNIKKRDNYQGVIRAVNEDGIHYDVEMAATKTVIKKVHKESIFKPGTERTFEIVRGNLFERSDSFRSDIILLPYSISNDSFRSLLLTGCKRSPIGSRILSFSHLEGWDGFPAFQLRRIDANVYDNDRYDTNMSPHQRLYLYQHVLSLALASSPKSIQANCKIGSKVMVRDIKQQQWFAAKVLQINDKTKSITVQKNNWINDTGIEEIKIDEQRIHLVNQRFNVGDLITAYCPKMIENNHDELYTLYRGQVTGVNDNGTYKVQYEDGETVPKINECFMFSRTNYKYDEGLLCIASRYDQIAEYNDENELVNIKNMKKKVDKNQCIIRHQNPDGTYRVEFINVAPYKYHDVFCEKWLQPIYSNDIDKDGGDDVKLQQDAIITEPKLPLVLEIDYDKVLTWKPNIVAHWLNKCGCNPLSTQKLVDNNVNGVFMFELDMELLTNDMKIPKSDASQIMRYMRSLKTELRYNVDEEDEELREIEEQMRECDRKIKELKVLQQQYDVELKQLIKANNDDYKRYQEYELKRQCLALKQQKLSNKEIAAKLKKPQTWVKKTAKLKQNQIKKPSGPKIKQMEGLQNKIKQINKEIEAKQIQMLAARERYDNL